MNIEYFQDTDTRYIAFRRGDANDARGAGEDTLLDLDHAGSIVAITIEHARRHAGMPNFSSEQVSAWQSS